jgi:hypothetical protein
VVSFRRFISSTDQFSIQKCAAVVIKYHKRARRGKYDCQPAEILGEKAFLNTVIRKSVVNFILYVRYGLWKNPGTIGAAKWTVTDGD